MDPIVTILLVSGITELNRLLKETSSDTSVEKIVEKFLVKIKSNKIDQLKGTKFEKLVLGTIHEIIDLTNEEALKLSEQVSTAVLDDLEKYGDNIKTLGKMVDAKFHEILDQTNWSISRQMLMLKYEFNKFVYLGKNQSLTISQFLENPSEVQKIQYGDFLEQCLTICGKLVNLPLSDDEAKHESFVKLVYLFQSKEKQFEFLHELMNIFYRLSTRTPGSMVTLNSVMDSSYSFTDFTSLELESAIIRFLNAITKRNVELPTPFHPHLKSFEILDNLIERLKAH